MRKNRRVPDHEGTGPKELLLRTCIAPQDLGITCGRDCAVRQALATSAAWAESRHARQRQWAAVGRGPPVAFPVQLSAVAAPVTASMLGETKRARLAKANEERHAPSGRPSQGWGTHVSSANPASRGLGRSERRLRRPPRLGGPDSAEPAVLRPHIRSVGTLAVASPFAAASSRAREGLRPVTAPQLARLSALQRRPVHYVDRGSEARPVDAHPAPPPSALEPAGRRRGECHWQASHEPSERGLPPAEPARLGPPFLLGGTIRARSDTVARLDALSSSSGCSPDGKTIADVWRHSSPSSSTRAVQLHRPFTSPVCRQQESAPSVFPPIEPTRASQRFWDTGEHTQQLERPREPSSFGPSLLARSMRCAERHRRETADYHHRLQRRLEQEANRAAALGAAREAARARLRAQYTRAVFNGRKL